jgi:hypothetical protein
MQESTELQTEVYECICAPVYGHVCILCRYVYMWVRDSRPLACGSGYRELQTDYMMYRQTEILATGVFTWK